MNGRVGKGVDGKDSKGKRRGLGAVIFCSCLTTNYTTLTRVFAYLLNFYREKGVRSKVGGGGGITIFTCTGTILRTVTKKSASLLKILKRRGIRGVGLGRGGAKKKFFSLLPSGPW